MQLQRYHRQQPDHLRHIDFAEAEDDAFKAFLVAMVAALAIYLLMIFSLGITS